MFTGKSKQVCELLSIKHLKTTAYHPQSNGILERWHGALKGILKKLGGVGREWDCLLKFCLLCYRSTPHTATGFSPLSWSMATLCEAPWKPSRMGGYRVN